MANIEHNEIITRNAILQACSNNEPLEVMKRIYFTSKINIFQLNELFMSLACRFNLFDLAKWLYSQDNFENILSDGQLECVCYHGNEKFVEWFFERANADFFAKNANCIISAMRGTNPLIVKKMYELQNISVHPLNSTIFSHMCWLGHIELVKWLCSIDTTIVKSNDAFLRTCKRDNIELAKWLCENGIDIHNVIMYNGLYTSLARIAFKNTYLHNCVNIAKWLYSMKCIDITSFNENDSSFLYACYGGFIKLVKWTCSFGHVNLRKLRCVYGISSSVKDWLDSQLNNHEPNNVEKPNECNENNYAKLTNCKHPVTLLQVITPDGYLKIFIKN